MLCIHGICRKINKIKVQTFDKFEATKLKIFFDWIRKQLSACKILQMSYICIKSDLKLLIWAWQISIIIKQ
jgi:hypothetical protein